MVKPKLESIIETLGHQALAKMTLARALDYLSIVYRHECYILAQGSIIDSRKAEISLVNNDGDPIPVTFGAFTYCPLSMPHRVFEQLLTLELIAQDRPEDTAGSGFYSLTAAGRERAKASRQEGSLGPTEG